MKGKRHTKIILLVAALVFFYVLLQGSLAIYREIIGDSVDLSITDTSGNYTVTFNANGGSVDSNEASRSLAPGSEVGELPIATRANYNFDGWYTDPNPNSGTKITDHTLVTGTVTYYAHWNAIVCKIASSLHEEVGTKTITYGNLVSSDTFESGDAFDCDVNNDGTFSASDERFYYLTDDSNGNAVMIYSNNTSGGVPICGDPAVSYNQEGGTDSTINNLGPISSMELLPSTTQWPNVSVHNQPRQITNHLGTTTTTAGTIVPFTYTNKAARYATTQEVEAACEITIPASGNSTNIDITKCEYFLENTSYNISSCRTNYWLETPASTSQNTVFRLARNSSKTGGTVTASNGKSGVRPAIEVPYDAIQPYSDIVTKYRVDFDSQGGSIVVHRDKYANQPIGELPTPTKDGFVFDGWYTTPLTGGTKISSSTVVTAPVTYYARWVDASSAFPYVYRMPGECTFTSSAITNGTNDSCISTINPTGQNIDYTDSTLSAKRYIDTGIALYDTTNHDSDYEIGFDIVSYSPTGQSTDATLMNTKAEDANANYPGVVFRRRSSSTDFLLQSRTTASTNTEYTTNYSGVTSVKIYRISNKIYYSINGGTKTELNTLAEYNPVFDLTTWFGAAPADATATTAQRYFKGTLSNLYIKLGTYPRESVTVTFHGNNGTLSFNTKTVLEDNQLGELPTATRSGYTFMGWYKESTFDTPVTESTNVTTDLTDVYARWAENVTVTFNPGTGGTVDPATVTLPAGTTIGSAIGDLPTPQKSGNTFMGWYEESTYDTLVTTSTVVNATTMFYARWEPDVTITFHGNNGTPSFNTKTVGYGSPIGQLPTATRSGYVFDGWYKESTFDTLITENTIVTSNFTDAYAKWAQEVTITLHPNDGTVSPNTVTLAEGATIGNSLPTPERNGFTFVGWYEESTFETLITGNTVVTTTLTDAYAKWESANYYTITYHPGTGATVDPLTKSVQADTAAGELAVPEKTGYLFVGWYTDDTYFTTEVTAETIITDDLDIYAKWTEDTDVACIGTTCYSSLELAVGDVPTDGTKTTVKLLKDTSISTKITVLATQNVDLNLQTYTVTSSTIVFENYGTIHISNGEITSTSTDTTNERALMNKAGGIINISGGYIHTSGTNVMENKGTVNITDGRLESSASAAVINNETGGVLNVSGGTIKGTSTTKGQGIYNNGGTTTISGTVYIENNSQTGSGSGRAAVHNNAGTVNILGGTIISKKNAAVKNNGTMTIGTDDGTIDTTDPVLQGYNYGLETVSGKTVYVYDGIFKGRGTGNKAISNESIVNHGTTEIFHTTETIGTDTYDVAYLISTVSMCTITFNPGQDGTVDPTSKTFTSGTAIGEMPTPQRTGYTFDGWYTAASGGTEVTTQTTFSQDDIIYAHWKENITINFNVNNGDTVEYNSKTLTDPGPIGTLPTATKANTEFLGWFTSASGGEKLLPTTQITSSDNGTTYYAHYTTSTTVCKRATTLHSSGNIDFGQIPSGSTLSGGDAFDCDVNGDGTYDATNERFYYLTDTSDGKAVLIFSNNIHQNSGTATAMCKADAVAYGTGYANGPTTAMEELPTTAQWSNVSLYTQPRTITNQSGTTITSNYIYTGKAARLANLDEIKAATTASLNETNNELASYTFLLENTASYGDCRSNYWLETTHSDAGAVRIDGSSSAKRLGHRDGSSGIRPVIEVPYASIEGSINIVEFDTIPTAMRNYFNNVSTWDSGQSDSSHSSFDSSMTTNLNNSDCVYYQNDNVSTEYGSVYCDQPNKYDTGTTGNINVYEYNESTGTVANSVASYVSNDNGKLYNFIPGKTYYWEKANDSTVSGYVRPTGERRILTINGTNRKTRNVRDLGGLPVDTNDDGTIDGKIKFQKLYRGEKIWGGDNATKAIFDNLGISNEYDLREQGTSEIVPAQEDQLTNYIPNEIIHYKIDYTEFGSPATESRFNGKSYYELTRDAAIDIMNRVVNGSNDYALYFHCRIGADRTGTLAYVLEGLLGVPTEYRYQDYELSVFFGLRERTRYYYAKGSNTYKFIYLKNAIRNATPNNTSGVEDVKAWFLQGSTNQQADEALIAQFKAKMIDYN